MIASFIVRLLDAEGNLLSWTEVMGQSRPQGRPRSTPFVAMGPSQFAIERDGLATQMSIHWHDLDVARVTPLMNPTPVQVGQVCRFDWIEPVWMVAGAGSRSEACRQCGHAGDPLDVPLPQVTVRRPVLVSPPPATVGAVGT